MTHETSGRTPLAGESPRKGMSARGVLLAGAAGASVLGVGLGLWARPAMSERNMASGPAATLPSAMPTAVRQIQIVVDNTPAPIGRPIEVLPTTAMTPPWMAAAPPTPEARAPVRPPQTLVRVRSAPAAVAAPVPKLAVKTRRVAAKTKSIQLAKGAKARTDAAQVRLAKVEAKAQVRKAHETRQALTEESRRHIRLAGLGHVLARLVPHPVQADPRPVVEKVSNRHGPGRKSRSAKLQKAVAHPARTPRRPEPARYAQAPRPAKAHPFIPPPKPVGLMKVSNRPRCASADPGAALVCADPSLGAADRQLARAYRQAQAAGVSDERLQRQQQRWLAARSAAAREAPWAVRDVYVARIAELNGMAQEAGGGAN